MAIFSDLQLIGITTMHHLRIVFFLVLSFFVAQVSSEEESAFIGANGPAEMKSGLSNRDRLLKNLEPGTPVKVIKNNAKLGYAKIELEGGETGWIVSKYLSQEAPPKTKLPAEPLLAEPEKRTPEQLEQEVSRLQTELVAVRQASADVLRIQAERDQLQGSVITLKRELDTITREKNALNEDQKQSWFMVGGLVMVIGIVLGVVLPRISIRRKNNWGSF